MTVNPPEIAAFKDMEQRLLANSALWINGAPHLVDAPDCWVWLRRYGKSKQGGIYGRINIYNRLTRKTDAWWVHRLSYVQFVGPIPPAHVIDHRCFNTVCINPAHLEAVTDAENQLRRIARTLSA